MSIRVGINGFGRIGRAVLRAVLARGADDVDVVAVNDLTDPRTLAHLFKYDSVHRTFPAAVRAVAGGIEVGGRIIKVLAEKDPAKLPWKDLGATVVLECTGRFTNREACAKHLEGGAQKVVVSAPAKGEDLTIVFGVNHSAYDRGKHHIVSCASCTTNCLAPIAKVVHETFEIEKGQMTTVHSYTNDQSILDLPHKDLRRARAAAMSIIPTTTGAARAVSLVLPALKGKLDGFALRVPTPDVSVVVLVAKVAKKTTRDEVNTALRAAAAGPLQGILGIADEPLVSSDYIGDARSSIVDAELTNVVDGDLVSVTSWYDNEWGFSNRLLDVLRHVAA